MNLHGVVSGAIRAVNPHVYAVIRVSMGFNADANGKTMPLYKTDGNVKAQVQALSYRDLQQIAGLNLNGVRRAIYLYGEFDGVVRSVVKGGDIVILPGGSSWLIAQVLEQWPQWCKVAVTLQNEQYICAQNQTIILDPNGNPILAPTPPPVTYITDADGNLITGPITS